MRQAELRHITVAFHITWVKPNRFKGVITNYPQSYMIGAGIVSLDGKTVQAKCSGLLGIFPITLPADDPKLANCRNHTFASFAPSAQLKRLTADSAVWTPISNGMGAEGPMQTVEVSNVKRMDGEITREFVSFDPQSGRLYSLKSMAGAKVAMTYEFKNFHWNPKTTSSTFTI